MESETINQNKNTKRTDTERLLWLYSSEKTTNRALLTLELRIFTKQWPTPEEIRRAIDNAMDN